MPDTYSFTSDKPWTNHEWLAEIIMAAAYRLAGAAGLVILKLTIMALSLACVWRIAMGDGARARSAAILTGLALVGILPRAQQVRPQIFSVLCFSALVLLLRRAEKRPALLWLAPPLLAFWANTHGGWLVGCGTLVLWCAARTWTMRSESAGFGRALATMWSAVRRRGRGHAGQSLRPRPVVLPVGNGWPLAPLHPRVGHGHGHR